MQFARAQYKGQPALSQKQIASFALANHFYDDFGHKKRARRKGKRLPFLLALMSDQRRGREPQPLLPCCLGALFQHVAHAPEIVLKNGEVRVFALFS